MGSQRVVSNREREEPDTRLFMAQYNRMEFNVPREHSFATTSTRSRCEYLMRNNGLVNDWNTVVEQLLTAHPKVVKKKKKKVIKKKEQKDDKNAQNTETCVSIAARDCQAKDNDRRATERYTRFR